MPSKRFWIITGLLVAGVGATTVAAHGFKHAYGRGDYAGYGEYDGERGEAIPGVRRSRWWGGPVAKDEFDARMRERFARIDVNGDGIIDTDEARQMIEKRMQRHGRGRQRGNERFAQRVMRRFDGNRDGKVTKAEVEGRISRMFARVDLDSDGMITDADLPPMLRGHNFLRGQVQLGGHQGPRGMRFLRGADSNGDGVIALDEAQAAAAKRLAQWDANQDGVIDGSDRESRRTAIVDYRVKRFLHRFGGAKVGQVTQEQFKTFHAERFQQLDYDNNGELTRDEMPKRGWRMSRRWHHHSRTYDNETYYHRHGSFERGWRREHGPRRDFEAGPQLQQQGNDPDSTYKRDL